MLKKIGLALSTRPISMKTISEFYQTHLQSQLSRTEYLLLIGLLYIQLPRFMPCPPDPPRSHPVHSKVIEISYAMAVQGISSGFRPSDRT
ncbi:MAG: hypothetical protein VKJ46_03015 [Leptolyngbyaceae bacterium]|nr:hypothetical protein [Leptolyngbyaceae bacterium]